MHGGQTRESISSAGTLPSGLGRLLLGASPSRSRRRGRRRWSCRLSRVTSDTVVGEPSRPRRGAGTTEGSRLWFETLRGLPGSTWAPGAQAGVGPGLAQHGLWPQASGLRTGGSRGDRRRGCPRRTRSQGVPPMSLLAVFVHALVASCVVTAVLGAATVQSGEKPWLYARPVLDALNAVA